MLDLTIGQLVDALRQKCMEMGIQDPSIKIYAHNLTHDHAEQISILMAQELGGRMTDIEQAPNHDNAWYSVYGRGCDYHAFFPVKEITAEAV